VTASAIYCCSYSRFILLRNRNASNAGLSLGREPMREGVSGLGRLIRCLVTRGGLRRGGRLIRRGIGGGGGRSVRGGTGSGVGVGGGGLVWGGIGSAVGVGVGGRGDATGGSACCSVVPGPWRRRKDKASALDGLESFHGVGREVEIVSFWRAPGSGSPSGSGVLAKGFGHAGSLGGVPGGELEGLLARLRYLLNWAGSRG